MRWIRFSLFALMLTPLATLLIGCSGTEERSDSRQDTRVEGRTEARQESRRD